MGFWSLELIFFTRIALRGFLWDALFFLVCSNPIFFFRTIHVQSWNFWTKIDQKRFVILKLGFLHEFLESGAHIWIWNALEGFLWNALFFIGLRQIPERENPDPANWWSTGELLVSYWWALVSNLLDRLELRRNGSGKLWNWENLNTCRSGSSCPWTVLKVWRRISTACCRLRFCAETR